MLTAAELAYQPDLKVERGIHHINDLSGRISAFMAERPFKFMVRYKRMAGQIEFFSKAETPIPRVLSLILGDAVHNLRSALDVTLFGMACDRSPSPHKIQFPFPHKKEGLESAVDSGHAKFAGEKVAEAIRRLQPYPGGHPILSSLHCLDLRDKHRLLIFTEHVPEIPLNAIAEISNKFSRIKLVGHPGAGIRYTGDQDKPIFKVENVSFATRLLPDSESETATQPTFEIAFGKGQPFEGQSVIRVLNEAVDTVKEVVAILIEAHLSPENSFPRGAGKA